MQSEAVKFVHKPFSCCKAVNIPSSKRALHGRASHWLVAQETINLLWSPPAKTQRGGSRKGSIHLCNSSDSAFSLEEA